MTQTSPPHTELLEIGGHAVRVTTVLTPAGFSTTITVPPGCSREFRAMLAACAQSWCKVQLVEHEEAALHHRWQANGETLLLEGAGWHPNSRDLLYLSLFLKGEPLDGVPTVVTEDLETPVPPLRLHDLPASVRAADMPDPLLARTG